MSKRTNRLSDQILILNAISCVRDEMRAAADVAADNVAMSEIYTRLVSLQACLNEKMIAKALKEVDKRSEYEGA